MLIITIKLKYDTQMEGMKATIHRIEKNINYAKNRIYKVEMPGQRSDEDDSYIRTAGCDLICRVEIESRYGRRW